MLFVNVALAGLEKQVKYSRAIDVLFGVRARPATFVASSLKLTKALLLIMPVSGIRGSSPNFGGILLIEFDKSINGASMDDHERWFVAIH